MKPFPKWIGYIALFAGLLAPGGALLGLVPAEYAATVSTIAAAVLAFTHSLQGTGGQPNP